MNVIAQPRLNVLMKRCLSREEAAAYVGLGATKFDELVGDGRMPKPFRIDEYTLWDIRKLPAQSIYVFYAAGFIKIGWSLNWEQRLETIQAHCPLRLAVLTVFPGTRDDERALHERFSKLRSHGEWFRHTKRLRKWVDKQPAPPIELEPA